MIGITFKPAVLGETLIKSSAAPDGSFAPNFCL